MNRAVISRTALSSGSSVIMARAGATRSASSLNVLYKTVMRSTPIYAAFILAGSVVGTYFFNSAMDVVWESANAGKLYHHVDWSKWAEAEEEEEEEAAGGEEAEAEAEAEE